MRQIDLLVAGAAEGATPLGRRARGGAEFGPIHVLPGGAVAVDQGRIVEIGDHETLLSRPGIYRELVGADRQTDS